MVMMVVMIVMVVEVMVMMVLEVEGKAALRVRTNSFIHQVSESFGVVVDDDSSNSSIVIIQSYSPQPTFQISIKLLIYYEKTYKYIYTSVMQFVQNPFAKENMAEWDSLEELLIASCLVGIPWATLREGFVRRLFYQVFFYIQCEYIFMSPINSINFSCL